MEGTRAQRGRARDRRSDARLPGGWINTTATWTGSLSCCWGAGCITQEALVNPDGPDISGLRPGMSLKSPPCSPFLYTTCTHPAP